MAFAPHAPVRLGGVRCMWVGARCGRSSAWSHARVACGPRVVRLGRVRASFGDDLATRTVDVAHGETDVLIRRVRGALDAGGAAAVPPDVVQDMVVHLGDSRGMARLGLVDAFGRVGSAAVEHLLAGLRSCPNPVVRRSCGKALAKIGDPAATDDLVDTLLNDEDSVTRASAAGALAKMGRTAIPKLLAVVASPDSTMTAKGHASWAITFMQSDPNASAALFDQAADPNADVRLAVVAALGAVASGGVLPSMGLADVCADDGDDDEDDEDAEDGGLSAEEARGLRERAVEVMRRALDDEDGQVRAEAATGLANAGVLSQAGRISALLADGDVELRRTAALALMKLGDVNSLDALRACADNENEEGSLRSVARLAVQTISRNSERDNDDDGDDW